MKASRYLQLFIIFVVVLVTGYWCVPHYSNDWMDSGDYPDPYSVSANYLVSTDLDRPIFIACHGFSASTAEWQEFKEFAEAKSNAYVHLVLLGGHGRCYEAFKQATWQDWRAPIEEAIRYYTDKGFKHIHLVGSSAAAPLLLSLATSDVMNSQCIESLVLIDPFIIPKPKIFRYIDTPVSWFIRVWPVYLGCPKEKFRYFYGNYPISALKELNQLTLVTRSHLNRGIVFPKRLSIAIFQSSGDPVSDANGATVLVQHISPLPTLYLMDSQLHVFTRHIGQDPELWTDEDRQNQEWAFYELLKFCNVTAL